MNIDKRTLTVVGVSTALGFIGDVATFSIGAKKLMFPKGKELVLLIVLGIVSGFIIDAAIKAVDDAQKLPEEKKLEGLVDKEKKKILSGEVVGKTPVKVDWV